MMLHRHFEEQERLENMTTSADIAPRKEETASEADQGKPVEAPKRRTRAKKAE